MDMDIILPNDCLIDTKDLDLIDVLWKQDVDLGVPKEVYDQGLREELEREKELELQKEQERQKLQLLAREKEEHAKQAEKDKWLRENFRRDGETGEWVRLPNDGESSSDAKESMSGANSNGTDDFLSLEAALDYLTANVDADLLQTLDSPQAMQGQQQYQQELTSQDLAPRVGHQDSLEESWNGIADYLSMANDMNIVTTTTSSTTASSGLSQLGEHMHTSMNMTGDYGMVGEGDQHSEYLIQNATLPSPVMDMTNDMTTLNSVNESLMPQPAAINTTTDDFDLNDLSFFGNLTTLQNASVDDLDLAEVDNLFRTIGGAGDEGIDLGQRMDVLEMHETQMSQPALSMASLNDFNDSFDGLEGAIGGSDFGEADGDISGRHTKLSRLSESSSDSGFAYQGFSSSASSASSTYAGSPAGSSHGGNGSTSSNDTEHDPHGTKTLAHHHIAHNHTYNTPPGQVPREVKKYAQKEPSRKGPQSRDQRRAEELKVPFTIDEIIESPVERFNDMLASHKMNEAQLSLVRDIRRRGKNKVAAQNCRKRKVNVIVNLSDEMMDLEKKRDRLVAERAEMEKETRKMKEKFGHLYTHIFQSLRDERGEPYDPNLYSLQQSSDGNVFLVPRNISVNSKNGSSTSSSPSSSKDSSTSRKRKSPDE